MIKLTAAQRQYLKGLAHTLSPVIIIGDKGLTEAVLKETDRALEAHELIKIRAGSDEIANPCAMAGTYLRST